MNKNKNKYYRDTAPDEDKEREEVRELKAWRRRYCEEHPWKQSDFVQEVKHEQK